MVITYVTITYNAAQVLKRTLDSVLQQDYRDIVHLIIDGASTDGTLQIVDDYIQRSNAADNGHRTSMPVTSSPPPIQSVASWRLYLTMGTVPSVRSAADYRGTVPSVTSPPSSMAKPISSMPKAGSFTIAVSLPRSTSPGNPSVTACSSVIRPSTPVPTLP